MVRQNTSIAISVDYKKYPETWSPYGDMTRTILKETPVEFLSKATKNPANVNVQFGLTVKIADYESARLDVGITMPCDPDKVDDCYNSVRELVDERLNAEVDELKSDLAEKAKAKA